MIRGTEFEFLLKEAAGQGRSRFGEPAQTAGQSAAPQTNIDSTLMQTRLDRHYYTTLWDSLFELPKKDRSGIQHVLEDEIALRNVAWVLRLRTYYQMRSVDIREHLVILSKGKGVSLSADAAAALELPLDTRAPWDSWKRAAFLNPEKPGEHWTADPRYFQNAASQYLYRMARLAFRRNPFSMDTTACFIKLKQFEEDLLTSIAEGLALGIASRDVMTMLEVKP
jgi:vacuolar-type H+-ATPase subunit C/Vma6